MTNANEGALTHEQRNLAFEDVTRFLEENKLTHADFAKGIREKQSTVSLLFSNNAKLRPDTRDELLRKGLAWIELETRAIESRQQLPCGYYDQTKVALRGMAIARKLTERVDCGVCWGPAGIGKSIVFKAVAAELPNAIMVSVREDSRRYSGFLRALYNVMQRRRRTFRQRVFQAEVVELLKQSSRVASRPLMIVDQAHLLHDRVLHLLMDINEEAQCSILLVGTVDAHKRVTFDDTIEFGQLSSRFGVRCNLAPEVFKAGGRASNGRLFSVKDIRAIFQRGQVRLHSEAVGMLCDTANTSNGHLRRVDRLVPWAYAIARKRCKTGDVTIIAADVLEASRIVEGEDERLTAPVEVGGAQVATA
ncbi:MAG TPA: AAA family ATPase [Phycisphaerae bacterium]|nr:AAA family ATPase [Phycisphaerae bacterium]